MSLTNQFACHCCGQDNTTPALKAAVVSLSTELGHALTIDCAYRCPKHNKAVGGVPNSEHVLGLAADVSAPGISATQLYLAAIKVPEIHGIGRDDHKHYLHIDVRERPAKWCYATTGHQMPWYPPTEARVREDTEEFEVNGVIHEWHCLIGQFEQCGGGHRVARYGCTCREDSQ